MHKLVSLMMAAALGAALMFSAGAPYDLMEERIGINRTAAAEVIKDRQHQDAMFAALDQPTLDMETAIVWPRNRAET